MCEVVTDAVDVGLKMDLFVCLFMVDCDVVDRVVAVFFRGRLLEVGPRWLNRRGGS